MTRKRADVVLVERGFFASRARAQEAIAAGLVTVNGTVVRKASDAVPEEAVITAEQPHPYVSRGGLKLAAALDAFQIDPKDRICLDIGASTAASPRSCSRAAPPMSMRWMWGTASSTPPSSAMHA